MADVTYVITIKDETSGGGGMGGNTATANSSGGVAKSTSGENASGPSLTAKSGIMMGVATVRQVGNRVADVYINNHVGLAEGHTTLQAKLNYNKQVATRALSIGIPLITGIATGNPLMVAAGIGSAVSWGVDIAVAENKINLERQIENIGIGMANVRAGAGGDRSGRNPY